ncbi:MAG TPA: F0F1 ATP synthase subunit delta, partial [Bacteroidota bacterium]|nr:F0F1 ATP synthase subunit delta [Bacteroidota bacterium]
MRNLRVARRYAAALMAFAEQSGRIDQTARDCALIDSALSTSRSLRLLTASPVVSPLKKASVFKALFATRIDPHT